MRLPRLVFFAFLGAWVAGCAGSAKKIDLATQQEKKLCSAETQKLLGPVLGEIKTLKDQKADLVAQAKSSSERLESLVKSNKTLSEALEARKGQLQRKLRELVSDKDELSRKLSDEQKARIAREREAQRQQGVNEELEEELAPLRADREKAEKASARAREQMAAVAEALAAELQARSAALRPAGGSFELTLPEPLLFEAKQAKLSEEGVARLDRLGAALARLKDCEIRVEGHTDNAAIQKGLLGGFASHWDLAAARAVAVARHLHEKAGLDPRRIAATSRGEFSPLKPNGTPEGRQANRRMVLVFTPFAAD